MNTVLKLGLFAAIGLLVWGVAKAVDKFTVELISFGKPSLRNYALTVPLVIRFNNPTPVPVSIDRFFADIFVKKGDQFVKAGVLNQPLDIPGGVSDGVLFPVINLDTIFGGNFLNTASFVAELLRQKIVTVRVDYTPIIQGVALPVQSFTDTVDLS